MIEYYEHSLQHLLEALHRLDLLIELRLLKFHRQHKGTAPQEFRGLYISDEEIATALQSPTGSQPMSEEDSQREKALRDRLAEINQHIHQKTVTSLRKGILLYLPLLANIFELSPFEIDTLLICLAPEIDLKYE
ncbi:MAG: hypothetical protein L0Y56_15940, partial [Nitrospira sp.]|nr:hypothetical protein [Nitrospira sp.]